MRLFPWHWWKRQKPLAITPPGSATNAGELDEPSQTSPKYIGAPDEQNPPIIVNGFDLSVTASAPLGTTIHHLPLGESVTIMSPAASVTSTVPWQVQTTMLQAEKPTPIRRKRGRPHKDRSGLVAINLHTPDDAKTVPLDDLLAATPATYDSPAGMVIMPATATPEQLLQVKETLHQRMASARRARRSEADGRTNPA